LVDYIGIFLTFPNTFDRRLYLDRICSPTVKKLQDFNIITSPEESSDTEVAKAVLEDIKVAVNE
jgi:hypothetical protein